MQQRRIADPIISTFLTKESDCTLGDTLKGLVKACSNATTAYCGFEKEPTLCQEILIARLAIN